MMDDEAFVVALGRWCMAMFDDLERPDAADMRLNAQTRRNLQRMFNAGIAFERSRKEANVKKTVTTRKRSN